MKHLPLKDMIVHCTRTWAMKTASGHIITKLDRSYLLFVQSEKKYTCRRVHAQLLIWSDVTKLCIIARQVHDQSNKITI